MTLDPTQLPDDITALKAMLIATAKRAHDAETRASTLDAEIENLKLTIAKLQHDKFGTSSERARLLDQLELQLAELEEQVSQNAAADEIAALPAAPSGEQVTADKPPRRRSERLS
jgi:transposase